MKLFLKFDSQDSHEFIFNKKKITIGRNIKNNITIDSESVNDIHALIEETEKGFLLKHNMNHRADANYETHVNGSIIKKQYLGDGDVIAIGEHQIIFYSVSAPAINDQIEATVMVSSDFQKELQKELAKNKSTAQEEVVKEKKQGFFSGIKKKLGL